MGDCVARSLTGSIVCACGSLWRNVGPRQRPSVLARSRTVRRLLADGAPHVSLLGTEVPPDLNAIHERPIPCVSKGTPHVVSLVPRYGDLFLQNVLSSPSPLLKRAAGRLKLQHRLLHRIVCGCVILLHGDQEIFSCLYVRELKKRF